MIPKGSILRYPFFKSVIGDLLEGYWRNLIPLNALKSETGHAYIAYFAYNAYNDWRMLDNISEVRQ
jgi:hypothetical protein